ncbi:hypothetical protein [Candidatus Poriferisodalis sp.]|uniref:hypothetical protein n=1 Tax=Candidatus Poriferisodalis sp. TaxID=3101277 RepID=UPI003B017902
MRVRSCVARRLLLVGLGVLLGISATAVWAQRFRNQPNETVTATAAQHSSASDLPSWDLIGPPTFASVDGMYLVGDDLAPGRYVTRSTAAACYYAVTTDLSESLRSVVTTYFGDAFGRRVELAEGQYFETDECGRWHREALLSPTEDQ